MNRKSPYHYNSKVIKYLEDKKMTFENIIDIFSEHLKNDENVEIVMQKTY